jgi:hypothetical protein
MERLLAVQAHLAPTRLTRAVTAHDTMGGSGWGADTITGVELGVLQGIVR